MAERYSDDDHCLLFLAGIQESWADHVTPSFIHEKKEVHQIACADVAAGRNSRRNLEEPLNCSPPFASPVSADGLQSSADHAHYLPYVSLVD